MAAGKRGKVKLQTVGRNIKSLDFIMEESGSIREIATPSATDPEHITPMEMLKDMQPTTYNQAVPSSLPSQPIMSHTAGSSPARQRKAFRGSTGNAVRRSASTPNVRGYPTGDLHISPAEKRRNKLGYHRISLACGMVTTCILQQLMAYTVQVTADGARLDVCPRQTMHSPDVLTVFD